MKIAKFDISINRRVPNPDPIRDALQSLPGAGSVQVTLATDEGVGGALDAAEIGLAAADDAFVGGEGDLY